MFSFYIYCKLLCFSRKFSVIDKASYLICRRDISLQLPKSWANSFIDSLDDAIVKVLCNLCPYGALFEAFQRPNNSIFGEVFPTRIGQGKRSVGLLSHFAEHDEKQLDFFYSNKKESFTQNY